MVFVDLPINKTIPVSVPFVTLSNKQWVSRFILSNLLFNSYKNNRIVDETPVHIHPPYCAGIRCSLGECVEERRICDGIRDCKDGSDESEEQCHHKKNNCNHTECGMPLWNLLCLRFDCLYFFRVFKRRDQV